MIERVSISPWVLEIDRGKTVEAYDRLPFHSQSCTCLYCENFEKACAVMPPAWWELFIVLGIDPRKASGEVWQNYDNEDTTQSYGGIFHLCGRVVSDGATTEPFNRELEVSFTNQLVLVSKDFPAPILQMEFVTTVPWVLPVRLEN